MTSAADRPWMPSADKSVAKCQVSDEEFGMFLWRHHCRFSGQVCVDRVSNFLVPLPDLGWFTPQRICDPVIGLASTEPLEDMLIATPNKSEIVAVLTDLTNGGEAAPLIQAQAQAQAHVDPKSTS